MAPSGVVLLMSSYGSNQVAFTQTRKIVDLFESKRVTFTQVDGANDADMRKALWEKSGKRTYPQVFFAGEFLGDLDTIQELLDAEAFDEKFKEHMEGAHGVEAKTGKPASAEPARDAVGASPAAAEE